MATKRPQNGTKFVAKSHGGGRTKKKGASLPASETKKQEHPSPETKKSEGSEIRKAEQIKKEKSTPEDTAQAKSKQPEKRERKIEVKSHETVAPSITETTPTTLEELRTAIKGKVLTKEDGEEYEKYRTLWDPKQTPTYLVVPKEQRDVGLAMRFARRADIVLWAKNMPLLTTAQTLGIYERLIP